MSPRGRSCFVRGSLRTILGGPEGSPRTDKLIAASVQWAELIMKKVDSVCGRE